MQDIETRQAINGTNWQVRSQAGPNPHETTRTNAHVPNPHESKMIEAVSAINLNRNLQKITPKNVQLCRKFCLIWNQDKATMTRPPWDVPEAQYINLRIRNAFLGNVGKPRKHSGHCCRFGYTWSRNKRYSPGKLMIALCAKYSAAAKMLQFSKGKILVNAFFEGFLFLKCSCPFCKKKSFLKACDRCSYI